MFDPNTEDLLRGIPALPDFDAVGTPQFLTQVYVGLLTEKLRLVSGPLEGGSTTAAFVARAKRLANTLECFAVQLPDREDARASAFAAAQARLLIDLAEQLDLVPSTDRALLAGR